MVATHGVPWPPLRRGPQAKKFEKSKKEEEKKRINYSYSHSHTHLLIHSLVLRKRWHRINSFGLLYIIFNIIKAVSGNYKLTPIPLTLSLLRHWTHDRSSCYSTQASKNYCSPENFVVGPGDLLNFFRDVPIPKFQPIPIPELWC